MGGFEIGDGRWEVGIYKKDYDEPIAIAPIHSKLKKKVTYFTINFFPF